MSFRSWVARLCAVVAGGAITSAACTGTSTPDSGTDATVGPDDASDATLPDDAANAMACSDFATATCSRLDMCEPGTGVLLTYGTLANCLSAVAQSCLISLSAPETGQTAAHEEACAVATVSQSCADRRAGIPLDACAPPAGPGAAGAPCFTAGQCQSRYCQVLRNGGAVCGTCQAAPALGASCAMFNCARGQTCSASLLCATPVAATGACDLDHPCLGGLVCLTGSTTSTSGTCQPLGLDGESCDPHGLTAPGCDAQLGLYCNPAHQCGMSTLVSLGTACGSQSGGAVLNVCAYDAECVGSGTSRACIGRAAAGQPCDTSMSQGCVAPARCIGSTVDGGVMGTCVIPDPTTCH